ncbi:hypothetical protein KUF93_10910 [Streptococcus equi subsp. zooepidemicus]|uniref:hypothetical protein n=1 Tax=Streptococcus equi TaxID=1336 RepID=UPI001E479C3A|nr:hypothetical protein [Streptococcus equi]MCD3438385.1 hypothetical protein [Streptococcus equi subsp. zooepidemicus]
MTIRASKAAAVRAIRDDSSKEFLLFILDSTIRKHALSFSSESIDLAADGVPLELA